MCQNQLAFTVTTASAPSSSYSSIRTPSTTVKHNVIRRARTKSFHMIVAAPSSPTDRSQKNLPSQPSNIITLPDTFSDAISDTISDTISTRSKTSTTKESNPTTKKDKIEYNRSDGGLLTYLKEIGKVDLLEGHEVVECARHVRNLLQWESIKHQLDTERINQCDKEAKKLPIVAARYRKKKPSIATVSAVTIEEWAQAVGKDVDTFKKELALARSFKDRLVSANLRLVVSIAKRYMNNGVSLADLIQEGSIGLIRGAEKFDHTKGFRFATYVSWWIRQAIQRAISDSSRSIRLPTHVSDIAKKAAKIRREIERETNHTPSNEEVAEIIGIKSERLTFILSKEAETETVSLDVPVYGSNNTAGRSTSLGDMIQNTEATPEEIVSAGLLRDDIENVLLMLSPREREVLRMRYGFDDGRTKNFEEIGAIYCVSPGRIRQIEARAIRKLRHPNFNRCLTDWRTN